MTAQGRYTDVSQSVPSEMVKGDDIREGDVFSWRFLENQKLVWRVVTVCFVDKISLLVQINSAGSTARIPKPSRVEVLKRGERAQMFLSTPKLLPGALPNEIGAVLAHLESNGGIPNWRMLNCDEIAALEALERAGYVKAGAWYQYR